MTTRRAFLGGLLAAATAAAARFYPCPALPVDLGRDRPAAVMRDRFRWDEAGPVNDWRVTIRYVHLYLDDGRKHGPEVHAWMREAEAKINAALPR